MIYRVNDSCIGCGLCAAECPSVFHMTDEGMARAIAEDVPAGAEQAAEAAKNGCPVGAIESE